MYPTITIAQEGRPPLYLTLVEPLEIGRECDGLLLADEKVSRRHLRLTPREGSIEVQDLGSTNGSYIDRGRIDGAAVLVAGSVLVLGDTSIRLEPPPAPTRPAADVTTRDAGGTIVATLDPAQAGAAAPPAPVAPGPAAPAPAPPSATMPAPTPAQPSMPAPAAPVVRPAVAADDATRRTSMDELVASLGGDPIGLPSGSADDTVTIMFSDIESSTEIALGMGDQRWYEVLTRHNQLVEQRVAANGGFIVKNQGDGFMITFNSARRAIICAAQIQQNLYQWALSDPANAVRVRIGMHTGEAIRQNSGDLFGRHVIIAARVGGMAEGAEILVSSIVREIAAARGDLHFGDGRNVELKGVGQQVVYPVLWGAELPAS